MGSILLSVVGGGGDEEPAADSDSPVKVVRSKASWDEHLEHNRASGNRLTVVNFSASWCGPCRFMNPVFESLACNYSVAAFLKIDVDAVPEVAKTFGVKAMPTFVLVKRGQEISRVLGAKKNELEREIQRNYPLSKQE